MPKAADGSVREAGNGPAPEPAINFSKLPGMVAWYSPSLLAETGTRHFISRVFGQFADQRIMQATVDGFAPDILTTVAKRYDYSDKPQFVSDGAFWVDYVSDLGDGFDSTYSVASLIAADSLEIAGAGQLPAAKLLIMGGDQVYPFPTRQAYRERLETPYKLALPGDESPNAPPRRELFVLPGNHDWYDGLTSFDFMFCKARYGLAKENRFGGWLCPQHRSYFALKLPHNWWIWGADIQMSQYLDAGQVLYFREVARQMREHPTEAPKVIFCIAEPSWQIAERQNLQGEGNLDLITEMAVDAGARVCAVLAGDLHHYSRYFAPELGLNFITTGGGGAYFSPTHWLKDKVELNWSKQKFDLYMSGPQNGSPEGSAEACWPSRSESRKMSVDILAFPYFNYWFSVCLGILYWIMTWQFAWTKISIPSEGGKENRVILVNDALAELGTLADNRLDYLSQAAYLVAKAGQANPMLGLMGMGLFGALWYYADAPDSRWRRMLMALLHFSAHIAMMIGLYFVLRSLNTWLVTKVLARIPGVGTDAAVPNKWLEFLDSILLPSAEMVFVGAIGAGFVWGLYLTVSCLLNRHCDDAFSSMRVDKYKHFLRMKIEPDKLTIYPIGLKDVPARKSWRAATPNADNIVKGPLYVPARPLKPVLIEKPIEIRVGDVKRRDPNSGRA